MPYKNPEDRRAYNQRVKVTETPEHRAERLAKAAQYRTEHKAERAAYQRPPQTAEQKQRIAERGKARRQANPGYAVARAAATKARRLADPEFDALCKARKRATRRKRRGKPDWQHAKRRERLAAHGWTPELRAERLAEQGGACAICGDKVELLADHEHVEPPKPRGLLCNNCNTAIGMLRDSSANAENAMVYLRKYEKP